MSKTKRESKMDMSLLQLHKMKVELEELMNTIVMPPSCMNKMSTGFSCIYSGYGHVCS